ncbi:MAG: arylsulfatase [Phycisphaerae bacterium]|nr:arylsulfatase [Phycisphaerae bacterium]
MSHRRTSTLIIAGLCGIASLPRSAAAATADRPNIILIMADDMGFSDIGCYGGEIQTPNLDRLAAGGMRFTQFYNTARCCPTRAALLTGLYSHQAGVGHMVGDYGKPGYRGFLSDRCVTIGEALRPAGYTTLITGKWHVGEDRPHWPCDRGFDRYFGLISGGTNYWRLDPGRKMAIDNTPFTPGDGFYITDAFTDYAVKFIGQYARGDKPFFLYVPYTAPHWPLHAWPEDIAKYKGKYMLGWDGLRRQRHKRMIEMGIVDARWGLTPRDTQAKPWSEIEDKPSWDLRMAVYAAQIDRLDQNVGRIMAKLREMKIEDSTLVMFLADNGGCAERIDRGKKGVPPGPPDSFLSYNLPWANASNTPFRLYKHWVHEGGISTPLIAYWPKVIKPGQKTDQPGHVIDLMATCVDVAGAKYPAEFNGKPITPLEGKSLVPIFRGEQRKGHEAIFWEHEGNRAVRQGKWKLVSRFAGTRGKGRPGKWELYDMEADRTELKDLAENQPEKVNEMVALYDAWAKRSLVEPWPVAKRKKKP